MTRFVFKLALTSLTTCGLAGFASSTARAQSDGTSFMTPPLESIGGSTANGMFSPTANRMFSPAANGMFGTPFGGFDNTPRPFGIAPPGTALGDLQFGVNDAYGPSSAYGAYNGNISGTGFYGAGLGPGYYNYGGGYLNYDGGFRGNTLYYGDNTGYGVNYGAVNSGSYGNYAAPVYYGNGYYGGYYGNTGGGYEVNYGPVSSGSDGNYAAPVYNGGGYYSNGISGNGYSP